MNRRKVCALHVAVYDSRDLRRNAGGECMLARVYILEYEVSAVLQPPHDDAAFVDA